ncbi:MAG: 2-oxoglutarate dehydrogenase complex dihydrolipoyllysine-residue succinyltransferase [Chloroflexota bacterium]|nr:2-oxoglutarate dehydrogenase complex dihydrolipoyllysine-residue succinyltransferase [Chloroflexota bacterium]
MPVEIVVPPLGESLVDAVVGQWLKAEGDEVSRGETVVELETDKVNLDVTAAEDGVLSRIDKREGDVVTVGEVLGLVGAGDGAGAGNGAAPSATTTPPSASEPQGAVGTNGVSAPLASQDTAPAVAPEGGPAEPPAAASPTPPPAPPGGDAFGSGRAAPAVRRLAEEHHVDLATVVGSGPAGRVTREDVLAQAARQAQVPASTTPTAPAPQPAAPAAPTLPSPPPAPVAAHPVPPPAPLSPAPSPTDGREERVRLSRRRQTIAQRLVQAQQTAAMLTTFNEVDMTAVMAVRARRKDAFKERHGVGLGFMSFFTKASIGALKAFPRVNAEIQGDELVLKKHYDIGVAVGVEEGLVVPVVRDADRKSFAEIEREIGALAVKARENKLALADLQGGTFTITNGGVFGSLLSTPILNAPQVGILGMHAIQQRPVVRDGEVVVRPMMYLALSYDHRIVDGREAVQFLVRIKDLIEDPETLLLEG